MKRVFLIMSVLVILTGCAGISARREFSKGAKGYTEQILPEYRSYIQNDPTLEDKSKEIRIRTANEFEQYIFNGAK